VRLPRGEVRRRGLVHDLTVAGALEKMDARDHRIAEQRVHREDQGTLHHPVDQQAMLVRVDLRHAAMTALEMQAARRDGALERLERSADGAAARGARLRAHEGPSDLALELRRSAVRSESAARRFHPRWNLGRIRRRHLVGATRNETRRRQQRGEAMQESTSRHPRDTLVHATSRAVDAGIFSRRRLEHNTSMISLFATTARPPTAREARR
jgi:hypothetical protein